MKLFLPFTLSLPLALALCSCQEKAQNSGNDDRKPTIAAVNYPLAYFAERLAGDFAEIIFEVPPGEDPAFWKPTDQHVARIQQADLILLNGANYAKWTATASLPFETTVDTSATFAPDLIKVEGALKHAHSKSGDAHSHAGIAFTTWLDLEQAAAQAAAIAQALIEDFPDHQDSVSENLGALQDDLNALDAGLKSSTAALKGSPVIASHPVYQYFARAYGLDIHSLLWEPEMDLDAEAMADLAKLREAHPGAKYFLWEGEPRAGHIDILAEAGLTSIVISPCGNRPESGDFLSTMQANIDRLEALRPD